MKFLVKNMIVTVEEYGVKDISKIMNELKDDEYLELEDILKEEDIKITYGVIAFDGIQGDLDKESDNLDDLMSSLKTAFENGYLDSYIQIFLNGREIDINEYGVNVDYKKLYDKTWFDLDKEEHLLLLNEYGAMDFNFEESLDEDDNTVIRFNDKLYIEVSNKSTKIHLVFLENEKFYK